MAQGYRWIGLEDMANTLRRWWDKLTYMRLVYVPPDSSGIREESADTFRLDLSPVEDLLAEIDGHLPDGADLENPEQDQVIDACIEWIKARAANLLLEYPTPAGFKVFLGGLHEKQGKKRDLTSARFRVESLSPQRPMPPHAPAPPPASAAVPPILPYPQQPAFEMPAEGTAIENQVVKNAMSLVVLMNAFCQSVVTHATQLNGTILTSATQSNNLSQTMLVSVAHQNEVLQSKLTDSSTRLFQRADEQQQRSTEERRDLYEQQAEERKAATRMEIGKQIVHQLGALGQTYLGGKAIPPELLELLPILPPEVFQALTDKDVIDALKNSAELREVLKEMVVNVRDSVKAGKAKAEAEAAQKAAGEKNHGGKPPNNNEEAA